MKLWSKSGADEDRRVSDAQSASAGTRAGRLVFYILHARVVKMDAAMRRDRAKAGQAMTEYGIIVALTSGLAWLSHAAEGLQPRTVVMAVVAGVALLFVLTRR